MKILIIGHNGNLGSKLMEVFAKEAADVIGWDREDLDITNKELVLEKVTALAPDLMINAAAYNAVDKCEEDEKEFELAKKINGYGPGYLAQACKKIGAILVHYSTDYVFLGDKKEGYTETDQPAPLNNYGKSKLLGEQEIAKNLDKFFIVRTSKLFGPLGPAPGAKKSFIDIMLGLAEEKDEIEVVDEEVSCFTYTVDLAQATRELVAVQVLAANASQASEASKKDDFAFGIYHLVNEGPCTWYACAKKVFEIAEKDVTVKPVSAAQFPRPAKRPDFSVLLNTKGPKMRNWEKAVGEYLAEKNQLIFSDF